MLRNCSRTISEEETKSQSFKEQWWSFFLFSSLAGFGNSSVKAATSFWLVLSESESTNSSSFDSHFRMLSVGWRSGTWRRMWKIFHFLIFFWSLTRFSLLVTVQEKFNFPSFLFSHRFTSLMLRSTWRELNFFISLEQVRPSGRKYRDTLEPSRHICSATLPWFPVSTHHFYN